MKVSEQRLGVFERLHGLGRVDDDLVVLVDRVGAVAPQDPVQPRIGVARGMAEREAGRRVVLLQRLAHFQEAGEVLREFLEARLVQRRLAVGQVAADGGDRDAEPLVALLAGRFRRGGPAAVFLAEIVRDVVELDHLGGEELRQRVQAPGEVHARPGVGRDRSLRLHVLERFARTRSSRCRSPP